MGRGCLGEWSDFFLSFVPVWPTRHRADRWCCYTLGLLVQKVPSCPILPHSSWFWRIMFLMESSTAPPVLSVVGCEGGAPSLPRGGFWRCAAFNSSTL